MKYYATGRRKTAIARVWLMPGEGKISINRRDAEHYLTRPTNMKFVEQPMVATDTRDQYDVWATARGGGISGQAGSAPTILAGMADNQRRLRRDARLSRRAYPRARYLQQ